jgi:hypothetical protein
MLAEITQSLRQGHPFAVALRHPPLRVANRQVRNVVCLAVGTLPRYTNSDETSVKLNRGGCSLLEHDDVQESSALQRHLMIARRAVSGDLLNSSPERRESL